VSTRVGCPVEVTTVVGNLVDNAMEAARLGTRSPAWVEVNLVADGATLHVSVGDSGDGVPRPLREKIFLDGVSTRDGDGRGQGLALARNAAEGRGGWLRLIHPGDGERGAVFAAELPGVLVTDPAEGAVPVGSTVAGFH
jgi:two-component system CitB family sensor kinase